LTHFVQPEKIEIDANERAVNEKSPYCFFVCTTFDSFLNDLLLTLYSINLKNGRFFLASQSKSTCHFQNENSKCLRVPYLILGAKKQEIFSDFLLSKAVKI